MVACLTDDARRIADTAADDIAERRSSWSGCCVSAIWWWSPTRRPSSCWSTEVTHQRLAAAIDDLAGETESRAGRQPAE